MMISVLVKAEELRVVPVLLEVEEEDVRDDFLLPFFDGIAGVCGAVTGTISSRDGVSVGSDEPIRTKQAESCE